MKVNNDGGPARPRMFTVRGVAEMLGCSERTVWRLLATGRLAKVKVGRAVRIPLAEVERFISQGGAA